MFKKGDRVKVISNYGRGGNSYQLLGKTGIVTHVYEKSVSLDIENHLDAVRGLWNNEIKKTTDVINYAIAAKNIPEGWNK